MGIINIPGNAAMALTAASEQSDKISQKRSPASRRCLWPIVNLLSRMMTQL
jgi:hypothetical protein